MAESSVHSEFANDPDFRELLTMFTDGLPEHQTALNDAFAAADWGRLREVSHQLKGCGAGYGFPGLTDLAAQLEYSSRDRDESRIETDLNALQDYLDRLITGT